MSKQDSAREEGVAPFLKVVTPNATPEEVAAIVAVLSAMGGAAPEPEKPRSLWASPAHRMRAPLAPGRGAWRASTLYR